MVQLPEKIDPVSATGALGFPDISAFAAERLRRSAVDLFGEVPDDGIDCGFRQFKLDESNFRQWSGEALSDQDLPSQIEMHVDHLDADSEELSVLYELLLKSGFTLTTKAEPTTLAGKNVFSVEDGALLICLEKEITPELIDALAEANPLQVICLDEGFKGNDQLKANAVQTFRARAEAEESEIVFRTV